MLSVIPGMTFDSIMKLPAKQFGYWIRQAVQLDEYRTNQLTYAVAKAFGNGEST